MFISKESLEFLSKEVRKECNVTYVNKFIEYINAHLDMPYQNTLIVDSIKIVKLFYNFKEIIKELHTLTSVEMFHNMTLDLDICVCTLGQTIPETFSFLDDKYTIKFTDNSEMKITEFLLVLLTGVWLEKISNIECIQYPIIYGMGTCTLTNIMTIVDMPQDINEEDEVEMIEKVLSESSRAGQLQLMGFIKHTQPNFKELYPSQLTVDNKIYCMVDDIEFEISERTALSLITTSPHNLNFIQNAPLSIQREAVRLDESALEYVEDDDIIADAIRENVGAMRYVKEPSLFVQLVYFKLWAKTHKVQYMDVEQFANNIYDYIVEDDVDYTEEDNNDFKGDNISQFVVSDCTDNLKRHGFGLLGKQQEAKKIQSCDSVCNECKICIQDCKDKEKSTKQLKDLSYKTGCAIFVNHCKGLFKFKYVSLGRPANTDFVYETLYDILIGRTPEPGMRGLMPFNDLLNAFNYSIVTDDGNMIAIALSLIIEQCIKFNKNKNEFVERIKSTRIGSKTLYDILMEANNR